MTFVASDLAIRTYTVAKQMGRPLPRFSDDPVIDYLVAEAVMLRGLSNEAEQAKKNTLDEWKHRPLGSGTPGASM